MQLSITTAEKEIISIQAVKQKKNENIMGFLHISGIVFRLPMVRSRRPFECLQQQCVRLSTSQCMFAGTVLCRMVRVHQLGYNQKPVFLFCHPQVTPAETCEDFEWIPIRKIIKYILLGHNGLRNRVAKTEDKTVSNMNYIHWDYQLERMAEGWIAQCNRSTDSCNYICKMAIYCLRFSFDIEN